MSTRVAVLGDLTGLWPGLQAPHAQRQAMVSASIWRPVADMACDVVLVVAAILVVITWGPWLVPVAVLLIGNRQRALGNILHDAGHRNLSRRRGVNDGIATLFLAPLLFADIRRYRDLHARHHRHLGDDARDPDYLFAPIEWPLHWWQSFISQLAHPAAWRSSLVGHLGDPALSWHARGWILLWWSVALVLAAGAVGVEVTLIGALLWMLARASSLHAITTFREMCDHHGREPGGVFSFTRDMVTKGPWRWLIHPRNNGYHLTHHLWPAVPYYRLPQAHQALMSDPVAGRRMSNCTGYFTGEDAVVRAWERGTGRAEADERARAVAISLPVGAQR